MFGGIYEQILFQLNCSRGTDLMHSTFLKLFSAIMNNTFTARPCHPGIKVSPMELNHSERKHIAAGHCHALNSVSPFLLHVLQLFHLLLLHGIMCLRHYLSTSFSSHIRYQHDMVWYFFQLELLHLLLLQDGILNQPRLHSSILLTCLIVRGVPIPVTGCN